MLGADFEGKHAVVTGGASGVGAALLETLAELGKPRVTVLDLRRPTGPHDSFLETDLSSVAALEAAISKIDGPVDVLFNNAGVADTAPRDTVIAVNVFAPLRLTRSLLPLMSQGGAVVNTASIAGMGWPQRLAKILELLALDGDSAMAAWFEGLEVGVDTYSFTKEVIQVWTLREAAALQRRGIRINSVCPSPIDTPLVNDFRMTIGEAGMDFTIAHSGGRMVSAREVASVLAFLGSPAASFVSGQNIDIDFGFRASVVTGMLDTSSVRTSAGRD
jgi:NAD(P)-dependent dehydrogenase (short-subunit alcohol dehydrogenase family)